MLKGVILDPFYIFPALVLESAISLSKESVSNKKLKEERNPDLSCVLIAITMFLLLGPLNGQSKGYTCKDTACMRVYSAVKCLPL